MALQRFSTPFEDFGNRWAMPVLNVALGGCVFLAGLVLIPSGPLPVHGAVVTAVLGAVAALCGACALVWRVAARRPAETLGADKRTLLADLAVAAGWLPLCLALLIWGGHGLRDDARRPFVIVGTLQELELHDGRGGSARLWLGGVPHAYHWRCRFDCRPWRALATLADDPGQRVRATVVGRRLIGLEVHGRTVLSPETERRRWILGDLAITSLGLVLTSAFVFGTAKKACDLADA